METDQRAWSNKKCDYFAQFGRIIGALAHHFWPPPQCDQRRHQPTISSWLQARWISVCMCGKWRNRASLRWINSIDRYRIDWRRWRWARSRKSCIVRQIRQRRPQLDRLWRLGYDRACLGYSYEWGCQINCWTLRLRWIYRYSRRNYPHWILHSWQIASIVGTFNLYAIGHDRMEWGTSISREDKSYFFLILEKWRNHDYCRRRFKRCKRS